MKEILKQVAVKSAMVLGALFLFVCAIYMQDYHEGLTVYLAIAGLICFALIFQGP